METKSLLVGEGASDADVAAIEQAILAGHEVERIIHMKTLYLGPGRAAGRRQAGRSRASTGWPTSPPPIDVVERRIRDAVPAARVDLHRAGRLDRPRTSRHPATDAIVIKGLE